MKYPQILELQPAPSVFEYDAQWSILYALAVGAGTDPADLRFTYERQLQVLPTAAVIMANSASALIGASGLDFSMIVHGEQRLTVTRPLPPAGRMISRSRCLSVVDKGADRGALVNIESIVSDADSGVQHATAIMTLFCRGDGGFSGPTEGALPIHAVPDRPHDIEVALTTLPQQAAFYRLLGDRNPLHIDPAVAAAAGFEKPILHGLCTYAIACRAILASCCANDPALIEHLDARFSSPVYPGDRIVTRIWRDAAQVSFECFVPERQAAVIRNGSCRLRGS